MDEHQLFLMTFIAVVALAVNIPLGYAREGTPRFSAKWYLFVHLSVPLIAFLRITNHLTLWAIPAFIACAVLGQLVGGRCRRRRADRA